MNLLTRNLVAAAIISICLPILSASQNRGINIESYDIHATIKPHAAAVDVKAVCQISNSDTNSTISFLFAARSRVESVRCKATGDWLETPFTFFGKDTIRLSLPEQIRESHSFTIMLKYAFPADSLDHGILMLGRGDRWYPLIVDQIARVKLTVDVPEEFTVLSAGNFVHADSANGQRSYVWESTIPIFKIPMLVLKSAYFTRTVRECSGKSLVLYTAANDTAMAALTLAEACDAFTFYQHRLGDYPFEQLTMVEVPIFEGMEICSGLLLIGSSFTAQMKQKYFDPVYLGIAQQWFTASVFAKFGGQGFWFLTLSLPHHLRLTFLREIKGESAYNESYLVSLEKYKKFAGMERDVPILGVDYPNSPEKGLVLYAKGPLILDKIKNHIGDAKWTSFLRELYSEYRGKILSYDGFQTSLAKYDKDGSTLSLFDKMMNEKGMPGD